MLFDGLLGLASEAADSQDCPIAPAPRRAARAARRMLAKCELRAVGGLGAENSSIRQGPAPDVPL